MIGLESDLEMVFLFFFWLLAFLFISCIFLASPRFYFCIYKRPKYPTINDFFFLGQGLFIINELL